MKMINLETVKSGGLREKVNNITSEQGVQAGYNALTRLEAALKLRKPTLGLFDHTGHIIGGGQKYGFTVANALQDMFDITLILNREITHKNILDWYHLDLSACKIKIVEIPFYNQFDSPHLDPARVSRRIGNPFHIISRESGNYDFFINNSMNEMVYPLSNVSSLICHFPERRPKSYFYADKYTHVIYNSKYTAHWIERKWKFKPHQHIYPPVDMAPSEGEELPPKENIILSVARFEAGGSKKQLEMVKTFLKINRRFPELAKDWQLVLAGGSPDENDYLKTIRETIARYGTENKNADIKNADIKIEINISGDRLKSYYRRASVFWHLCGLDQEDPALVEHFGMTIGEAMQNRIAPIVFDGGGQREIVEHGENGFRVDSTASLMRYTLQIMKDRELRRQMGQKAFEKSDEFSRQTFEKKVRAFFSKELEKYLTL